MMPLPVMGRLQVHEHYGLGTNKNQGHTVHRLLSRLCTIDSVLDQVSSVGALGNPGQSVAN